MSPAVSPQPLRFVPLLGVLIAPCIFIFIEGYDLCFTPEWGCFCLVPFLHFGPVKCCTQGCLNDLTFVLTTLTRKRVSERIVIRLTWTRKATH